MARIGLLTCSNMTNEMACSSFNCLESSLEGKGEFARYADRGGAQILGIISCSGCPTLLAPEKIIRRVRTLVATGVEAIHFAYCVEMLCPFKDKYMSLLRERFPEIEFVSGSHERPSKENQEAVGRFLCEALAGKHTSMADWIESRRQEKGKQADEGVGDR